MDARIIAAQGIYNAVSAGVLSTWDTLDNKSREHMGIMADGAIVALRMSGYEIVKTPEPDGFGEWSIEGEDDFSVSPIPLMELESGDMQVGCQIAWGEIVLNLGAESAKSLAAALLGCAISAAAAEAQS